MLGPTNTGKTHYALERMLGRESGIIGLPLRLLAREVYDRIVALRGPNAVSLITGEEKIAPARARYHVCTVEAMPLIKDACRISSFSDRPSRVAVGGPEQAVAESDGVARHPRQRLPWPPVPHPGAIL